MSTAPIYELIKDFGGDEDHDLDSITTSPHWIIAIIRLGHPLSFDRSTMSSDTKDISEGALLRADAPLVITGDCIGLGVTNNKSSHTKNLSATLKQTEVNYLTEILPGDWVMAWIVNNETDYNDLLRRINPIFSDDNDACNKVNDGLKFIGRLHSIQKTMSVNPGSGIKSSSYQIQAVGFNELDTTFFYEDSLASKDKVSQDIGTWLARVGLKIEQLFKTDQETGIALNNVNFMIPTLVDLIVGRGAADTTGVNIAAGPTGKETVNAAPTTNKGAEFSYLIPTTVGRLLGKGPSDVSKTLMGYCDILEILQGIQEYPGEDINRPFTPVLDSSKSSAQRQVTKKEMLGTFLPFMPEFTNRPLWGILQQYLNPAINEMYTCLRVNPDGFVVPTIVLRQIPYTTEAFSADAEYVHARVGKAKTSTNDGQLHFTRFLSLPRWKISGTMIHSVSVGRSDATRCNFVHVYGTALYSKANIPIGAQIVNNPPIMDSLDIQRSGLHSYMSTVECTPEDEQESTPGLWMALIADWMMGSQYTLNGTINSTFIQSPICEGDNLEWDGVVYHIESVAHNCSVSTDGMRSASTSLALTNGMRSDTDNDVVGFDPDFPIYPGFNQDDNRATDPGLTHEGSETTGGTSDPSGLSPGQLNKKPGDGQ